MPLANAPIYRAEITNHDGYLLVVLFASERLFSRDFRKICDAERWLTTLARRGLTPRALAYLGDEGRHITAMPPFGAIAVYDGGCASRRPFPVSSRKSALFSSRIGRPRSPFIAWSSVWVDTAASERPTRALCVA